MNRKIRNEKQRRWTARKVRTARSTVGAKHPRLVVFRTARHIYAQLVDPGDGRTLGSVSTRSESLRGEGASGNVAAAKRVVFNRNGFLYHGRVKALAEAAREAGLKF
jgi:large subunit ribosomal protein L18